MSTGKASVIEAKTEAWMEELLAAMSTEPDAEGKVCAYETVDVEYVKEGGNFYLRIYADKEGGIGVDDCEAISRRIEAKLDAEDLIADAYILEVSSPGLTRPLKKEKDYRRNLGKPVEVHLFKPVELDGEKVKILIGDLKEYTDGELTLDIGESEEELVSLSRSSISLVKQYVVF